MLGFPVTQYCRFLLSVCGITGARVRVRVLLQPRLPTVSGVLVLARSSPFVDRTSGEANGDRSREI